MPEAISKKPPQQAMTDIPMSIGNKNYGARIDGTPKGGGFLGELKRPNGKVSTEISIGVHFDGKEQLIPTLVPTLTKSEIKYLLGGGKPTDAIIGKAVIHARERLSKNISPFHD